MPPMKQRNSRHLIDQVINRSEGAPSYALLLGAGASVTSGVKTGEEMVRDWRRILYEREQTEQPFSEWLAVQPWQGEGEYGNLFEIMYATPSQRRIVVENLVTKAQPGLGYAYLANLLEHNYFKVVFTTNFDDLLTEACYRYTDSTRPLVAAHDSAMRNLRVNSARPKIVKLHGDFLYDSIKNTPKETENLEANTLEKVRQFSHEYGLVVIGYSGRDRSVMDALGRALSDEDSFPNGIYWCVHNRQALDNLSGLQRIAMDKRVYVVPIDGFDELMAEINNKAEIGLPAGLSDPYNFTRDRINILYDTASPALDHPIIARDISAGREAFRRVPSESVPLPLLATIAEDMGDKRRALRLWRQEHQASGKLFAAQHIMRVLADMQEFDELMRFVEAAPIEVDATYYLLLAGDNEAVIKRAEIEIARKENLMLPLINKAIAFKRLGRMDEMKDTLNRLELLLREERVDWAVSLRAGIAALRGIPQEMMHFLREALNMRQITIDQAREFPVFEDYRADEGFQALLSDYESDLGERA